MSSVTFRGLAGQSAFRPPFIANAAADLTVTVAAVTAPFTFAAGVVTITTPLVADADVVITDVSNDAQEAGGATEETLRKMVARPVALGYQQITVLTASTALTVPTGSTYAVIQAKTQDVRWRDDGVAPTATVGMLISAGKELIYDGSNLAALRFIQAAASAELNVTYYA